LKGESGFPDFVVLGREKIDLYNGMSVYPLELENRITDIDGVKHAIIISGDSKVHDGYKTVYLFVVPEEGIDLEKFSSEIKDKIKKVLLEEEMPEQVHVIPSKPISHFKVNKKVLRKNYCIDNK